MIAQEEEARCDSVSPGFSKNRQQMDGNKLMGGKKNKIVVDYDKY